MQELARMAVFAVVAEEENVSRAAERLGLSKSAVSKQLTALEESLGLQLLFRNARRTRLSDEGRALQPLCVDILQRYHGVRDMAEQLKGTPAGRLNLDLSDGIAKYVVLDRLQAFRETYPHIDLNVRLGQVSVQGVSDELDVAVVIGELPESSVVCRRLGDVDSHPFASAAYVAKYGMPSAPDDLHQQHCITVDYRAITESGQWTFILGDEVQNISVDAAITVNDSVAAKQLVMSGAGIAMLQAYAVREELASGALVRVLEGYRCPSVPAYVIYSERKNLSPKIRAMVDFLLQCFSDSGL